jgi:hypothetical protein
MVTGSQSLNLDLAGRYMLGVSASMDVRRTLSRIEISPKPNGLWRIVGLGLHQQQSG